MQSLRFLVVAVLVLGGVLGGLFVVGVWDDDSEDAAPSLLYESPGSDVTLQFVTTPVPLGEITMEGLDGRQISSRDWQGKATIVNFWATWCAPCIREMPSLVRLQQRLGGKAFTVIALSQDRKGFDVIKPFIAEHELKALPVYHDPKSRSALALKIRALPTSVLFDRQGRELGRLAGHAEWDSDEAVALIEHYLGRG